MGVFAPIQATIRVAQEQYATEFPQRFSEQPYSGGRAVERCLDRCWSEWATASSAQRVPSRVAI